MSCLMRAIRRGRLIFKIRCIEATISGQSKCIRSTTDPLHQGQIVAARIQSKVERFKLCAQLNGL